MCSADRQKPRAMGPPRAIADGEGDNYLYLHLFTQLNPPKPRQDSAAPRAVRHPTLDQHTGQGRVDAKPGDYSDAVAKATPSTFSPPRAPAPADPAAQGPRQAVVRRQRLHLLRPGPCLTSLVLPPPPRGALRRHRDRRRADHPQRGELAPPTPLGPGIEFCCLCL